MIAAWKLRNRETCVARGVARIKSRLRRAPHTSASYTVWSRADPRCSRRTFGGLSIRCVTREPGKERKEKKKKKKKVLERKGYSEKKKKKEIEIECMRLLAPVLPVYRPPSPLSCLGRQFLCLIYPYTPLRGLSSFLLPRSPPPLCPFIP